MHRPVKEHLEQYLRGAGQPGEDREFDSHLAACERCRRELDLLAAQSRLLQLLAPGDEIEAPPGFYARVVTLVESRRRTPVLYDFLDPSFGRRMVYACLATLLLLGSYLVYTEQTPLSDTSSPVTFLADDAQATGHVGDNPQRDRERVLVSLASYQE
jgi:anti-sigma factor RsiW